MITNDTAGPTRAQLEARLTDSVQAAQALRVARDTLYRLGLARREDGLINKHLLQIEAHIDRLQDQIAHLAGTRPDCCADGDVITLWDCECPECLGLRRE